MGYNETRAIINRNWPQLEQLIKLKTTLSFPTTDPRRLAHKLREARNACEKFEDHVEDFAILKLYVFKEERDSVLAIYNPVPVGVSVGTDVDVVVGEQQEQERVKRTEAGALSLINVLGELIGNKAKEDIHFPNVVLTEEDKEKLNDYTVENDWAFIDHSEKGITVTRYEVEAEIIWSPEDASTK